MAQEFTSYVQHQAGEGARGGGVNSVRTQELQNMRLVVDVGDGNTIEIPLKGHLTLNNCGNPSHQAVARLETPTTAAAAEQRTAVPSQHQAVASLETRRTAVGESQDTEAKKKDVNDMRGWLLTVATLFAGMSFEAVNQRPSWMPDPKEGLMFLLGRKRVDTKNPAQVAAQQSASYVMGNTLTFSVSLAVVVLLLLPKMFSDERTMWNARIQIIFLTFSVALNYASMISSDVGILKTVLVVITIFGVVQGLLVFLFNYRFGKRTLLAILFNRGKASPSGHRGQQALATGSAV